MERRYENEKDKGIIVGLIRASYIDIMRGNKGRIGKAG